MRKQPIMAYMGCRMRRLPAWVFAVVVSVCAAGSIATAAQRDTFEDGRIPSPWRAVQGDDERPLRTLADRVKEGAVVFEGEVEEAPPRLTLERPIDLASVSEVHVRFRVGEPGLRGWQVALRGGSELARVWLHGNDRFAWRGTKPYYNGEPWQPGEVHEIRYCFEDGELIAEVVPPDGLPRRKSRYRRKIPDAWRRSPPTLTIGGHVTGKGSAHLLDVTIYERGETPPADVQASQTVEQALDKFLTFRRGELTPRIEEAIAELKQSTGPLPPRAPRFETMAWDAKQLSHLTASDAGMDEVAARYTMLQRRSVPEKPVLERMRAREMALACFVDTRRRRYANALSQSPHVLTQAQIKGERRERFNIFNGDWIELATVQTLHDLKPWVQTGMLRRVLIDTEYRTGVGDDPLSDAARRHDLGTADASEQSLKLPDGKFTKVFADDDSAWRVRQWRHKVSTMSVTHRTLASAARRIWPELNLTTDPLRPNLNRFRGLDPIQIWVRVHQAPRHPLNIVSGAEHSRAHIRQHERPTHFVIGPQLGHGTHPTPPDMLTEACWLAVAFGARGTIHWGQDILFNDDGSFAEGGEATWHALRRMRQQVYEPMSDLLVAWEPMPRRLALLKSEADDVLKHGGHWQNGLSAPRNTFRALMSLGAPVDVLYDADVHDDRLSQYEALVVPSLYAANESLFEKLRVFAEDGGTIIMHKGSVLAQQGLPNIVVLERDLAPRYRDYWISQGKESLLPHEYDAFLRELAKEIEPHLPFEPRIRKSSPYAVTNLMRHDGTAYLIVVNDKRTYGPAAEQLSHRYMLDKGEPLTVRVAVDGFDTYTPFGAAEPLSRNDDGTVTLDLEPGWGRVLRLE
ncbi:MAG: beta-galactosidase trimerization domain-containing protein [Phycisphaeraceae bacterium]